MSIAGIGQYIRKAAFRADRPAITIGTTTEVDMEKWLPVKGYEDRYAVSNLGNIKRIARVDNRGHKLNECVIRFFMNNNGRNDLRIILRKNGNYKHYLVSRLVAEAFIPNPENLATVNHKNEDFLDNCVTNLEWLSAVDNIRHGTGIARRSRTLRYTSPCRKLVKQFTKLGTFLKLWSSCHEAGRKIGISFKAISRCATGKQKTAGGFKWEYLI